MSNGIHRSCHRIYDASCHKQGARGVKDDALLNLVFAVALAYRLMARTGSGRLKIAFY